MLQLRVTGLTKEDYKCPICNRSAQRQLRKNWIICSTHGLIEANIKIAMPQEAA